MVLSEDKKKQFMRRLLMSRMRILNSNGFYGLLLMHMLFAVDESISTACTDGKKIIFGTKFLDELSDNELDFVMMHEILHVALRHLAREGTREHDAFNIACDIVVNSNILKSNHMDMNSITLKKYGASMHLAPDGKEGYEYTAEEVYDMLSKKHRKKKNKNSTNNIKGSDGDGSNDGDGGTGNARGRAKKEELQGTDIKGTWDDHSKWDTFEEDDTLRDVWVKRCVDAARAISVRDPSNTRGLLPACAARILKELTAPQLDWRIILNDFVQEEISDYSFSPPDKRFSDSPFFLPDFNDTSEIIHNILFMIDTSGSVSDDMIKAAYSEIKGAIDQFDGKLKGWLGFFDAEIFEPKPFSDENELKIIRPYGGGGTDFQIIFEYVHKYMSDEPPVSIIILTDGYAPFPQEKLSMGIPVLWVINNNEVTPPWGKITRIDI